MNRQPKEVQLKIFTNVFEAFKLIDLPWEAKYTGFGRILLDCKLIDHWVITEITKDALQYIADNGFSKYNKGVVRGHILDRKKRAEYLFTNEFKSPEAVFDYYMLHDKVSLITRYENSGKKTPKDWSKRYQIPLGVFPYRTVFAAVYTNESLSFLKELAEKENIVATGHV